MNIKKKLKESATIAVKTGIWVRTVGHGRTAIIKMWESRKSHWWRWWLFTSESEKRKQKEKSSVCRRCETALRSLYDVHHWWWHIFLFMKNTWIGDLGASCHITNDDSGLYAITIIDESFQGISGIMPAVKKGRLRVKEGQVDGTEQVHTLWSVKFCPKAGANLFFLTCKLLQGIKITSDHWNNIVVNTPTGEIIIDCRIKTQNSFVAGVDFLHKANNERAVSATALPKRNINNLHIELGHPSETITHATTKALDIQVIGIFQPWKDCALGEAKQWAVSKKAVHHSKILGERLFFDISSPSTPTFGGKHHWLLFIDDYSNYSWSFFLKEKSNLVDTMLSLINNLKTKFNLQVQYLYCNNAGENQAFKKTCTQEGLRIDFE